VSSQAITPLTNQKSKGIIVPIPETVQFILSKIQDGKGVIVSKYKESVKCGMMEII